MRNRLLDHQVATVLFYVKKALIAALLVSAMSVATCASDTPKRRFTVADDIGTSYFGTPYDLSDLNDGIYFSPDSRYFIVTTARGALDRNQVESTVRIYRTSDVKSFLACGEVREPLPVWSFNRAAFDDGRWGSVITDIRWLANSFQFAFVARSHFGDRELFLADVRTKSDRALTPPDQDVDNFDILDGTHFAYFVLSQRLVQQTAAENEAGWAVGTGRSIVSLMFPDERMRSDGAGIDLAELWAVLDGRRFRVDDKSSGRPLPFHSHARTLFALAPDGRSVVTPMVMRTVLDNWMTLYQAPFPSDPYAAKTGQQDPEALEAWTAFSEYVSIDLITRKIKSLTHAPTGMSRGWWGVDVASWSADGREIALANTFLPATAKGLDGQKNRSCIAAVVDVETNELNCLVESPLDGRRHYYVVQLRFAPDDSRTLTVDYQSSGERPITTSFLREGDSWKAVKTRTDSVFGDRPLDISVKQDLNSPPVLVATDKVTGTSRVIFDPNPQLHSIDLGDASVFEWTDNSGRHWMGGLYKPPDYVPGHRYPLVIQTHGFREHWFAPSGRWPSAFAARELAGVGIVVLQIADDEPRCQHGTPDEGPCRIAGYESAIEQLASNGTVDRDHVGLVGFSRSCYAILKTLTTSKLHYAAASITDGVDMGYLQYLDALDASMDNSVEREYEKVNGGTSPFGEGLRGWLERVPDFNLDKIDTPLQVVANGRSNLLEEWEPYAGLRLLNRPVDLILLTQRGTHVLSNPVQRMVSQGGMVDWMRFWLMDEEDPDKTKVPQYARWRELRELREKNEKAAKQDAASVPLN